MQSIDSLSSFFKRFNFFCPFVHHWLENIQWIYRFTKEKSQTNKQKKLTTNVIIRAKNTIVINFLCSWWSILAAFLLLRNYGRLGVVAIHQKMCLFACHKHERQIVLDRFVWIIFSTWRSFPIEPHRERSLMG